MPSGRDVARVAGERGEPEEHFIRSYADNESLAFRGWKVADDAGSYGPGLVRSRTAFWLTVAGKIVAAHRTAEGEDEDTAMYEGEWTFIATLDDLEGAPNWIHNVTGYGPSEDDAEAAFRALEIAKQELGDQD